MKKICIFSYIFLLSLQILYSQTNNSVVQNVFIINIDGIRNNEGFKSENKYLHYIWDSLKPRGTIYTNFFNTGITVTNSAHSSIMSGVRQLLPNNAGFFTLIRPVEPGIGEYYIKFLNCPQNKVFYISGKNTIWVYPVSLYPGFGPQFAPSIVLTHQYDLITYNYANYIIDNYHPNFAYILFAEVDAAGHVGDSSYYFGAIRQADSLVYKLWKKVQEDHFYSGKTTFIIMSDHGRHDDNHGGWKDHGDQCHGCRHVPFIAIGPNIKTDTIITTFREQTDVVPTVADILGIPAPFAEGDIMKEMLTTYANSKPVNLNKNETDNLLPETNISNSNGFSRSASITSSGNNIHILYSDNSNGKAEIYYSKSSNNGETWNTPTVLFSTPSGEDLKPVISNSGNNLIAAVTGYKYYNQDSTYIWILHSKNSNDNGNSWSPDTFIDTLTTISCMPTITMNPNKVTIGALRYYIIDEYYSDDGGNSFTKENIMPNIYSLYPTGTIIDTTRFYAWQSIINSYSPYWNIYFKNHLITSLPIQLTNNDFNRYSYFPRLSAGSGFVHLVHGTITNSMNGNNWGVIYRRYNISANIFSSPQNISGSRNAYKPVVKVSDNGKIIVIWNDFSLNKYSIRGVHSTDNGISWSVPYQITSEQNYICNPDFSVMKDTLYIAWQDFRTNNWEIYFKKFNISELTGLIKENPYAINFGLMQNYPNPFNSSTTIKFSVTENSNVILKIYDVTGRENVTLINQYIEKGTYSVKWDASNYPSGIYFYNLKAGKNNITKKLILSK